MKDDCGKSAALSAIRKYADEYLEEPGCRSRRYSFMQCSYQRWAADELLRVIEKSENVPPVIIVEEFTRKMDSFSCKNSGASFIFSVAYDVAKDVLDLLIAMN